MQASQGTLMQPSVDDAIAGLRSTVSAKSDAELARRLGIDQSTISSWRSRGRVPGRFLKLLNAGVSAPNPEPPQFRGELFNLAQTIALVRFTLLRQELAQSRDIDRAIATFLDLRPFWLVLNRSVHDLQAKMELLGVDLPTAHGLLMQEDLSDPAATTRRVGEQLSEDLTDNPWLADWK